jgi:hypothetical protein
MNPLFHYVATETRSTSDSKEKLSPQSVFLPHSARGLVQAFATWTGCKGTCIAEPFY